MMKGNEPMQSSIRLERSFCEKKCTNLVTWKNQENIGKCIQLLHERNIKLHCFQLASTCEEKLSNTPKWKKKCNIHAVVWTEIREAIFHLTDEKEETWGYTNVFLQRMLRILWNEHMSQGEEYSDWQRAVWNFLEYKKGKSL